jgi:hypothetical protein
LGSAWLAIALGPPADPAPVPDDPASNWGAGEAACSAAVRSSPEAAGDAASVVPTLLPAAAALAAGALPAATGIRVVSRFVVAGGFPPASGAASPAEPAAGLLADPSGRSGVFPI